MKIFSKFLPLLVFLLLCSDVVTAQINISGVVTSSDDGLPPAGVYVFIKGKRGVRRPIRTATT